MQNISKVSKEKCCGCGACESCPTQAIKLKEDVYGFRYPFAEEEKCVDCGTCLNVCPALKEPDNCKEQDAYAARSCDKEVLKASASGGLSYAIGKWMIEKGGVVCGAAWQEDLSVKHIIVDNVKDLNKLQGSKYVQSQCDGIYKQIVELLKNNRPVLFTGTPCQVAAVKACAGKKAEHLYTIDLICHGVPNQKMFREYLNIVGKKHSGQVASFSFRNKEKGWGTIGKVDIKTEKKMFSLPIYKTEQSYYYYYLQGFLSRLSCYQCNFANRNRVGDITLGDYWGIEIVHPELRNTSQGISLMICNTEKGQGIVNQLEHIELVNTDLDKACKYNGQLISPQAYDEKREELMQLYADGGYESIEERFNSNIGSRRYTDRIKRVVPKWVIRKLKQGLARYGQS